MQARQQQNGGQLAIRRDQRGFSLIEVSIVTAIVLLIAVILFGIYYANWTFGWVTPKDLDFYNPPADALFNS